MKTKLVLLILIITLFTLLAFTPHPAPARPEVWSAKLTQNLTADPAVLIIANDPALNLTITRDAPGIYSITSSQPVFVEGKVFPTLTMGDAFVLTRLPKVFQFSNNPYLLKLFIVDTDGVYQDGWITYVKLEFYP